jgi:catechol 2,3-dioxygenase-like lactoylglutathione lyase family enzyme
MVSVTKSDTEYSVDDSKVSKADMKFELVVIPVSDVDRAKRFYAALGWRLDIDFAASKEYRVVQFTPPGSACSIIFGIGITPAAPGSAVGLYLITSDIQIVSSNIDFASSTELARALRRAAAAHHEHERRVGKQDDNWPDWYADYIFAEQAGKPLPS